MATDVGADPITYARALCDAGVPVVVCRPHDHRDGCDTGCVRELDTPAGWNTVTAADAAARLTSFRLGVDTLAMVAGHGVDVVRRDGHVHRGPVEVQPLVDPAGLGQIAAELLPQATNVYDPMGR